MSDPGRARAQRASFAWKPLASEAKANKNLRRNCEIRQMTPVRWTSPVFERRGFLTATGLTALAVGLSKPVLGQEAESTDKAIPQPINPGDKAFIRRAFEMRQFAVDSGDQAYGAVVVRDNVIVGQSWSRVILDQDPTAHAEMAAIRDAAQRLGSKDLGGSVMYSTSRPCPMCEAAAFWAGVGQMIYGGDLTDAGSPRLCR